MRRWTEKRLGRKITEKRRVTNGLDRIGRAVATVLAAPIHAYRYLVSPLLPPCCRFSRPVPAMRWRRSPLTARLREACSRFGVSLDAIRSRPSAVVPVMIPYRRDRQNKES
jgi:hypothetical protein